MKMQYLFGFTCKVPTQKETKLLLNGKSEKLTSIVIQDVLPKTKNRLDSNEIFHSFPYNFSSGFEKAVKHIFSLLQQKKNVVIDTLIIKNIHQDIDLEKDRSILSFSGEIALPYQDVLSGLGGSWITGHEQNILFTLRYKKGQKNAYIFFDVK
jgi:hypothetical protein